MGLPARKHTVFTYDDYLSWGDDERWEIIDGEAFKMAAAPLTVHQLIIGELMRQMGNQLKDGPCRVIVAPFDVRLPLRDEREEDIINVVQPDISVVCDPRKLDKKGCLGAPDLVIEILSPGTSRMDRFYKFNLYQRAGVKEYWLVSPDDNIVEVYRFEVGGNYAKRESYCETDTVQVTFSNGNTITIDLASVFRVKADTEAG